MGAARADQPAGPGKLLFTISELLKEVLPRVLLLSGLQHLP